MNYSAIKPFDIANGPGIRVSLFVSGCPHHCPGCFNPETWDFNAGNIFGSNVLNEIIESLDKPNITGFTVLGGEPLAPENLEVVAAIVTTIRVRCPRKSIWIYSGYTYEELKERAYRSQNYLVNPGKENSALSLIMETCDILVEGRFELAKKDLKLRFRGSSNQRIIDLKQTCWNTTWYASGEDPVLSEEYM